MKYKAKRPKITLDLELLNGEQVRLEPTIVPSARECIRISKEWRAIEENNDAAIKHNKNLKEGEKQIEFRTGIEINAIQLSTLYDKDKDWFIENLDPITIREIITDVAKMIAGIQKNSKSSDQ